MKYDWGCHQNALICHLVQILLALQKIDLGITCQHICKVFANGIFPLNLDKSVRTVASLV